MILHGNPVSGGIAVGKLFVYKPFAPKTEESFCTPEQAPEHLQKFAQIKQEALAELEAISLKLGQDDPEKAKIFVAHQDIVEDVAMNEEIEDKIREENWAADWAIHKIYTKFITMLKKIPDPLIQERAADLEDVKGRLLRLWHGVEECNLSALTEPVVVAAHDLLPSDTATLNRSKVLAILTEVGGPTSHSAIIARSYEIPAVLGISSLLQHTRNGETAAVNALTGEVILNPEPQIVQEHEQKRAEFLQRAAETKQFLHVQPLTADGVRIDIGLNIGSANDEEMAGAQSTDLVGLFRTEFLYMGRPELPSEEEQYEVYTKVLKAYGDRPVTLRTLDIGGDKTLESMQLPKEDNPFLGNRALRLCFSHPDVFKTQLRAALRASVHGNLWLMLPMVGSIDDIRRAKAILHEVKQELESENIPYNPGFKTGIMIEIPSIAMIADIAAKEVDFASLGTNDLCQYLTAVDRMNPDVAGYYQTFHPGLLRMIQQVVQAFTKAGKPVSVCGEMGGDLLAVPVLVGFGMRKLSMGLASVAPVKRLLSQITLAQAEEAAAAAVQLPTAADVENYLRSTLPV